MTSSAWSPVRELGFPCPIVLVVDDSEIIRRTLKRILDAKGWAVLEAADPVEAAVLMMEAERIDVILSDWEMPHGGGAAVLRGAGDTPVLLHSGAPSFPLDAVQKARGIITKPADADELDFRLREVLQWSALEQPYEDGLVRGEVRRGRMFTGCCGSCGLNLYDGADCESCLGALDDSDEDDAYDRALEKE